MPRTLEEIRAYQRAYAKKWRADNLEKCRETDRRSYYKNRDKRTAKSRKWNKENPERRCINQQEYYKRHYEYQRAWARNKYKEVRRIVLEHYGNKCKCCGESHPHFLAIDHINGGGTQHRKTIQSGSPMYHWIIKNNFPTDLQLLCHNCNSAKGFYGECPHETERRNAAANIAA